MNLGEPDDLEVNSLAELGPVIERCKEENRQLLKQLAVEVVVEAFQGQMNVDELTHAAVNIYLKTVGAADEMVDATGAQIERRLLNASQH